MVLQTFDQKVLPKKKTFFVGLSLAIIGVLKLVRPDDIPVEAPAEVLIGLGISVILLRLKIQELPDLFARLKKGG